MKNMPRENENSMWVGFNQSLNYIILLVIFAV